MQDVVIDLETLGTSAGCVILSIGAVYFGPKGLGDEFYMVINQESCIAAGLKTNQATLDWWNKQSPAAQAVLHHSTDPEKSSDLKIVLEKFGNFVHKGSKVRVWGNGADFDNPILSAAYAACQWKQPWGNWDGRCYRTLKSIASGPKLERVGTYHNALDDAKSQALHAIELFKANPNLKWA